MNKYNLCSTNNYRFEYLQIILKKSTFTWRPHNKIITLLMLFYVNRGPFAYCVKVLKCYTLYLWCSVLYLFFRLSICSYIWTSVTLASVAVTMQWQLLFYKCFDLRGMSGHFSRLMTHQFLLLVSFNLQCFSCFLYPRIVKL